MEWHFRDDCSTEELENALVNVKSDKTYDYFQSYEKSILKGERLFANYMRNLFKEKRLLQQEVFLMADVPETYGYRLISEERHTRHRDVILRICYGAHLSFRETQRALCLAGQAKLYPRMKRDAVLIIGLNNGLNVDEVNGLLWENGCEKLKTIGKDV